MENREFSKQLERRTKNFAINIIRMSSLLPKSTEINVIKNQLTKSGTSIGANYREANRARSKAEFRSKIKICESEASETSYWLELVIEFCHDYNAKVQTILREVNELLAVFSSIGKSLNSSHSKL